MTTLTGPLHSKICCSSILNVSLISQSHQKKREHFELSTRLVEKQARMEDDFRTPPTRGCCSRLQVSAVNECENSSMFLFHKTKQITSAT